MVCVKAGLDSGLEAIQLGFISTAQLMGRNIDWWQNIYSSAGNEKEVADYRLKTLPMVRNK